MTDNQRTKKRLLLIGLGYHAKRIYFPLIKKFYSGLGFELIAVVDLKEKEEDIKNYLQDKKCHPELIFIDSKDVSENDLSKTYKKYLTKYIKDKKIEGVIISTEPLVHFAYAKWALKNNLSILMDKPISTYKDISNSERLAKRLIQDLKILQKMYQEAILRNPHISFSITAQRRFHPAYEKIREIIKDCFEKTNCPVTSIQTFHCDGQWRTPTEMVEQLYHPFMQGYGKCSHSGYHFCDMVIYFLKSAQGGNKRYDNVDIFTNVTRPLDCLEQFNLKDYNNLFGKKVFNKYNHYNERELKKIMPKYGEVDAFSNIAFKKGDKTITLCSLNLNHTGFGKRDWPSANGRDLYKGNGRVRHEMYIIEQGPFQSIHLHSYQAFEVDPSVNGSRKYKVGGESHMDIYVFKNSGMIGGKTIEIIKLKDIQKQKFLDNKSRGHQEDARAEAFLEFISALKGTMKRSNMRSDLFTHTASVTLLSGIYQSIAAKKHRNINLKISL